MVILEPVQNAGGCLVPPPGGAFGDMSAIDNTTGTAA